MARRWTVREDRFVVRYFDLVGDHVGIDLGRTPEAATARVAKLKSTGAWQAYEDAERKITEAMRLAGHDTYWREWE